MHMLHEDAMVARRITPAIFLDAQNEQIVCFWVSADNLEIFPIVCCKQAACIQQLVKAFSQSVHVARCSLILGQNKCFEHFSHIFLNSLSKGVGRHHPWGPQLGHAGQGMPRRPQLGNLRVLDWRGEVEYSLRAIPLGGYVAFPDENDPKNPYKAGKWVPKVLTCASYNGKPDKLIASPNPTLLQPCCAQVMQSCSKSYFQTCSKSHFHSCCPRSMQACSNSHFHSCCSQSMQTCFTATSTLAALD
eukprot:1160926-Pelagomonas_calceolata.AAC.4